MILSYFAYGGIQACNDGDSPQKLTQLEDIPGIVIDVVDLKSSFKRQQGEMRPGSSNQYSILNFTDYLAIERTQQHSPNALVYCLRFPLRVQHHNNQPQSPP
tara:strand:+ start:711 stop:1016 length:306 start_codon:yes stop_codon:yes gene_type:complete